VSSVYTKDQSSSDLASYATSKSKRRILLEVIEKGLMNVKINTKNSTERGNLTNKIPLGIQNLRQSLFKAHFIVILKELRNRNQIEMQIQNQSNILENKTLVHLNEATRDNLTSRLILKCDVFLNIHGVVTGEPFVASNHLARTTKIHEPYVLQASVLRSRAIIDVLAVAAHRIITKDHGAKAAYAVGDEAQLVQLVLDPLVSLLVARGRCCIVGVVVKVAEGGT
jgi:hypothetical protein